MFTSLVAQDSKEATCNAGDQSLIPGSVRSPGEKNGNPPQYSCLENPMDRGAWQASVHGVLRVGHNLATKSPPPELLLQFITYSILEFLFYSVSSVTQSCLTLCNPMDCSQPAPLSMGFSRHEQWSALPFPTPGNLSDPGIEPICHLHLLHWQADSLSLCHLGSIIITGH